MALISFAGRAALRVILMAAGLGLLGGLAAQSQDLDCNENGISDQLDVRGQFSLRAPKVIPRGSRELLPTFVIGDFTGSTDTDLLVSTSEGLKVFLGDGTGDFSPGDPAFVQRNLIPLIAADFDGDSDLDIFGYDLEALFSEFLLSTNENRERLELGKAVNAVDSGRLATAADLDLDGDLDLGFLSDRQSAFFVQNNLGNGDFSVPEKHSFESVLTVPRSWLATRLWFEDLDANGSPDALILGSGPLRHYQEDILALNSGSGSFGDLRQLFAGLLIGSCVPADVDQDGKTDLVATVRTCCPEGGQATVMRQTGIAEFTPVEPSVSYEGYLYLTQRTDLDLDGFPEVLCATDKMSLMLRSQGAETFGDLQRVHVDAFATFEDVSGDGYPDAIAAAGSGLIVALNEGDGRHVTANQYSVPYTVPGLVSGDLDGDGDQDLLSSNVLRNQGDGEFDVELVAKNLLSGESLALLDLDLDGDLDVVVGNPDFLGCFETRSDGRLAPCPRINPGVARLGAMAPVDFNQDGAVDLVVGSAASDATGISVLSLRGHFRFQALTSLALTEVPIGIVAGDLDADGDPDFAIRTGLQRGIKRILNLSGSTLQSAPELEVSAGVSDLKVADLNGDLLPDIVVGHRSPAGVSVVLATLPPGSYAEPRVTAMPGAVEAIQPVDLDGNGTQELMALLMAQDLVTLLIPAANGFELSGVFSAGVGPTLAAVTDFDGDQRLDVAVLSSIVGLVTIFLNKSTAPNSKDRNADLIPDECQDPFFHRGDATGDGLLAIADAQKVLQLLFLEQALPECPDAADANDDGRVDVSDPIFLLWFLFQGGQEPPPPGPPGRLCGPDVTPGGAASLGCPKYDSCG